MNVRSLLFFLLVAVSSLAHAQTYLDPLTQRSPDGQFKITVERTIPVEFLGTIQPFALWDGTRQFPDERVRDENGVIRENEEAEDEEGRRGHPSLDPNALPHGNDPAWQTTAPTHGFDRAVDLSVNGMGNTSVSPADPCLAVGPNHVIQMINGSSGAYFRIYDKNLANPGSQTYMDNFVNSIGGITSYTGLGDPIIVYDALADRWMMTEFSSSGNRMIVAISTGSSPTGSWYAYSYTATNFPDYPKYAVWNNCYVVTTNENSPAIYALPRANMLAGTGGTAVRFTISSLASIGFQAAAPVHFGGGTPPPTGAPAMFMRMVDDAWTTAADVDRLELWNINYNEATPGSSTITGPTALPTDAFDSDLCGYTTLNCITQPGSQTMDPIREILMNQICYRNLDALGYEAIVCTHSVDLDGSDRACPRWYELHRTGGGAAPWSIFQQGTFSPDANDRWMPTATINNLGDIGLAYNIAGTTGGNVYPGIRYTGRYRADPLNTMTFAETSIVAGTASNNSNRYGDYNSLDVDPSDGVSFYGTAMYNPASSWGTRMFKFSFPVVGCIPPTVTTNVVDNCGAGTFTVQATIGSNGDSPDYDVYTAVNGGGQTLLGTYTPGTITVGTYSFGTSVVIQVRHNGNSSCNQSFSAITSTGTSCCTAPTATVTGACLGITNYNVSVDLTSMGSATSIAIQIDPDASGPNPPVTVQTVTTTGVYGPFGNYASGSPVNVILVHNLFALCTVQVDDFVKNCNSPGAGCGAFSMNTAKPIADQSTTTSPITVPAQGGSALTDLNVYVDISHTYSADLRISLTSPANTTVNLISSALCGSNDNIVAEFDDAGVNGTVGGTCPINNLFVVPAQTLSAFNGELFEGTWTLTVQDVAAADIGTINSWCLIPALSSPNITVSPKVFLEGPYNSGTGLMSDALRAASLVPTTEPYSALLYSFVGSPGAGGTLGAGVLSVTGNNAIVDWVVVELRNATTPATVVASCAALVQRDGDVVALDGTSPVSFTHSPGSYYVAMRHRNHLGVMTASTVALSASLTSVDFTSTGTATYGTAAQTLLGGKNIMWTGDSNFNHQISYTGGTNDRDPILGRINDPSPNATVNGYFTEDTNMNGVVSYTGSANDRDVILVNIGGSAPTSKRYEQLP
ncbi:MAG: proprotein convertase P-domain-containing protein [Flavobacteriales bacterium]|nr:proprotein convertase P-domain-containing protein [Flavobacteriales bacterium]MBK7249264.1 proprotein convertase P-domain-containing protein [Flavobacteriales bacterium]QQS71482.1 MAG: proprotein convertase P-domain-containing protein [Flavobacteriales bacterium]HQV38346.1 proprotein convertase P-domain-containing protein [Flavobacteriales bacterium]HQW31856.1 proprotein convertase P-domain-containing protein [Flavobacteriales bacterium]